MKKVVFFLLSLFFFLSNVYAEDFAISGNYVSLFNMNEDEEIYSKNADEKTSIASLTKIMTTIVAIENIDNLNDIVTIKEADFEGTNGYSKAGFSVGDKVTFMDLLYGIILPSGADAVNAVVNNTLGYDDFIKSMNSLAKKLNMKNTSFSNPVGKDDEKNYSTSNPYNAVKDTLTIYDYYNTNYGYQNILNDDTFIKEIPVKLSKEDKYKITGNEEINKYLKNDTKVRYEYEGLEEIAFNTEKGRKLGVVRIYDGDRLLATSDVVLENNIEYYPIVYFVIILLVVLVLLFIKKLTKKKHRRRRR